VFERSGKAGGILRYGIPDFKLEKWVIDRRLDQMKAEGVRFETEVVIGEDISARYLRKSFDVILLTVGAGEPRDLDIPGRGLEGVYFAMEYLTRSSEAVNGEAPLPEAFSARDRSVLVIGGGDTGSDCVGTANRQKAKRVTQFEILDKPLEWKEPWNPSWPEWPLVLRTSSSHEEGVERQWGVLTESFVGSDRVEGVCCSRVRWVAPSPSERPVMEKIPGSEFRIDAELVLLAMGFLHPEHGRLVKELGVRCNARGNIETDPGGGYATSVKRVFAAGDADTGASLVVRAIRHGREAAEEIDAYLKNA
jgi:NADPH-dependent glutamate synthase beta subunit-like oxidoreductase